MSNPALAPEAVFSQAPYRCRLEWGERGALAAAERGDAVIIVDTLSFSSAVVTAAQHRALVRPCALDAAGVVGLAAASGAVAAVHRADVPARGRFSLSPLTFVGAEPGTRIVLPSRNGGACSTSAERSPHVFAGTLLNASAVAAAAETLLSATPELSLTVVACGERWPSDELCVAIEDYLGAGAILAALSHERSPEAQVCEAAFRGSRGSIAELLWECGSGRELRARGSSDEVRHASQLDRYDAVPVLRDGWFRAG